MATKALLHFGNASANKWLLFGVHYQQPKIIPQTTLNHVRCFRKIRDASKQIKSPFSNVYVETGSVQPKRLWKAFGFSVVFSGASIIGAAIWQYENVRAYTYRVINKYQLPRTRPAGWRATIHNWWHNLDEGEKLFIPICFANVLVFCAWRVPAFRGTMVRYFSSHPASSAICWPMVLSTFSHYSFLHLATNMFVLHSFSSLVVAVLGKEQFLAVYLTSGVMSSFVSYLYKTIFALSSYSLGASGAIMGILGFACVHYPDTRLSILFLPMYTFTASAAIKVIIGFDTMGCIMGWRWFDHAAHLGGVVSGIFWQKWGNANIWWKREPVLTAWNKFREPTRSN